MTARRLTIATIWLFSLLIVATIARAQVQVQPKQPSSTPQVFFGADLGFRIDGHDKAGNPLGHLVVRINGAWTDATLQLDGGPRLAPLTVR